LKQYNRAFIRIIGIFLPNYLVYVFPRVSSRISYISEVDIYMRLKDGGSIKEFLSISINKSYKTINGNLYKWRQVVKRRKDIAL
jgi:hypothetical protein